MRIADRYILRELLPPFLLGLGGFLIILVGDILYTLAEYIVTGRVTLQIVLRLLAYKMPAIMVITFPVSTLFGALLGLSRLARDRELEAMRLMGTSLTRMFIPVLAFGVAVAGLTFLTNEVVSPWANQRANTLIRRAFFGQAFPEVREQVFLRGPGNMFLYVHRVDARAAVLRDVMIYETEGALPRLITASEATWSQKTWILRRGVARDLDAGGFTRAEVSFESMQINVGLDAGAFFTAERTPEEMTLRELRAQAELFRNALPPRVAVEYHRKFAIPAASLIFALIAAPLSLQAARGGRFVGMGFAVVLLFVYYVAMSVARALGTTGLVTPFLSAWAPNLLFLAGGCLLVAREEGWLRMPVPAAPAVMAPGNRP